jgi:uncharacterized membrane protein YkvA (DUF1232 family)
MKQEQESIESKTVNEIQDQDKKNKNKKAWAWIFFIVAIIYGAYPIDLIPDVRAVGWIDDIAIGAVAFTNLVQYQFFQANTELTQFFKLTKRILLLIAILIALVSIFVIQTFQQSLL